MKVTNSKKYLPNENHLYHDRLTLAINDFLRAKRYMDILKNWDIEKGFSVNRVIAEALSESTVTSYTRCFVNSHTNTNDSALHQKVAGRFSTYRKSIEDELISPLSNQHHRLREKRRNFFGHSSGKAYNQTHSKDHSTVIAHNPFYPFEEPEISWTIDLIELWTSSIDTEIQATKLLLQTNENSQWI